MRLLAGFRATVSRESGGALAPDQNVDDLSARNGTAARRLLGEVLAGVGDQLGDLALGIVALFSALTAAALRVWSTLSAAAERLRGVREALLIKAARSQHQIVKWGVKPS